MGNRYRDKIVGDRPWTGRVWPLRLEHYDLLYALAHLHYAENDEEKFKFGTPAKAMHTILRCWEYALSSLHIIQGILDLPAVH